MTSLNEINITLCNVMFYETEMTILLQKMISYSFIHIIGRSILLTHLSGVIKTKDPDTILLTGK